MRETNYLALVVRDKLLDGQRLNQPAQTEPPTNQPKVWYGWVQILICELCGSGSVWFGWFGQF